jgi:hypothetical protein
LPAQRDPFAREDPHQNPDPRKVQAAPVSTTYSSISSATDYYRSNG